MPGSDKRIVTQAETTLEALDAAARLLSPGGLLSVHVYTGHAGGMEEGRAVLAWSEALPWEKWRVTALSQHNKARNREWLVLAERLYLPRAKGAARRRPVRRGRRWCQRPYWRRRSSGLHRTCLLHSREDGGRGGCAFHAHGVCQKLTEQLVTPGTFFTAFSTRAEQAAQLMPVIS